MKIKVCEQLMEAPEGTRLFSLMEQVKPGADVICINGAPVKEDCALEDGDEVVFIRRGEKPGLEELEALMTARHTPGVHVVMRRGTVGIAGLGGLGSVVAGALARIGVGRLILADFDVVEPSNLNRQQYFIDQIGERKVDALAENLARINPYVRCDTHAVRLTPENIPVIFDGVDVAVEAFDTPEAKAMIAETFSRCFPEIPLVMASGLAGYESGNTIRTRRFGRNIILVGDLETAAAPGTGLMAPRVGIAAHHQANAVVRLLLGHDI